MHKTIMVDGQEYELQIAVRKVINNGTTAVSMDGAETEHLLSGIGDDLRSVIDIIDYAVEQRDYEASYENDDETRRCVERSARDWEYIGNRLLSLLEETYNPCSSYAQ